MACTPDGEWLVYVDENSLRHDEMAEKRDVIDAWRYEFKTKRRQRFAIAYYDEMISIGNAILAPIGVRVFLGRQPKTRVKKTLAPEWDIVWTQMQAGLTAWFHDSTAVVRILSNEGKDRVLIESLSPERETIVLEQRAKYILHVLTDSQNRIYMEVSNEEFEPDLINEVIRCTLDLKEEKLSCTPVLNDFSIKGFDASSDGEAFVLMEWRVNGCVKYIQPSVQTAEKASCITGASYHPGYHLDISPDDSWVAFVAIRKTERDVFANDLYLTKLKD